MCSADGLFRSDTELVKKCFTCLFCSVCAGGVCLVSYKNIFTASFLLFQNIRLLFKLGLHLLSFPGQSNQSEVCVAHLSVHLCENVSFVSLVLFINSHLNNTNWFQAF